MALEDRSRWAVSSGMGMGMVVAGPNPRQSTLVRLKLSNRPKLSTSQRQPWWQFLTALDWTETFGRLFTSPLPFSRPPQRSRVPVIYNEERKPGGKDMLPVNRSVCEKRTGALRGAHIGT
ncbi:hypothetical protein FQN60_004688 [Etheostoma spectabile]|uniref:Uncharacterized protein n=1 Tax=Etheostoma spectabile TaxID=54343 RepID=A0A5J5DKH0_9PERO|nr:hypothetical protein FQN60_004688 [Etheostoma spectabile]